MVIDWIEDLFSLTDEDWSRYVFNRDPLAGRIKPEQQMYYAVKAVDCGAKLAQTLRLKYGNASPEEIVKGMGLTLTYQRGPNSNGYLMFAYYKEPDSITIFSDNAEATDALLAENQLSDTLGGVKTADLLIAHELYHYLEQKEPDIFTAQKHLTLWKLGPFENRSRIMCLEEIGAMAFARELTGLPCSPYIFNVLMLYPQNPQKARKLFDSIMRFLGMGREQE